MSVSGVCNSNAKPDDDPCAEMTADELKEIANKHFKDQSYEKAIEFYTKAIDISPSPVYYANRSFAYLKVESFGYALSDSTEAIQLDKTYVKAYYRRASANMALGKFKLALKDFEAVVKVRPNDKDARLKRDECKKIVNFRSFAKAIGSDEDTRSIVDQIDLESMAIEDDYTGPKLSDEPPFVTAEFMEQLIEHYRNQNKLHRRYAYKILLDVQKALAAQPSLVEINVDEGKKFTVCGDIHGQFYDLLNIFKLNGLPSADNPYLFNGDFVDRGSFSVECIFTLFGYKLLYPDRFYMSRGNHESVTMNQMYGFEGEVKSKYGQQMVDLFTEVFDWLPLAHLINNRILVMHGGLFSDDGVTLDDIRQINRNRQPPENGPMCDLLWSDPQPLCGRSPSKRGVACMFGPDITKKFLKDNSLDYIIRSHEVKPDGYSIEHSGDVVTVFSAPNYCDTMGNSGAFITLTGKHNEKMEPKFTTYEAVPHPNVKPMQYANSFLSALGLF